MLDKMETADGLIVGSPVYFASPNGALISLMDRIFMAGGNFRFKPAACVTSARRGGTTATLEVMNKYFLMSEMPIVSANYCNMVHGHEAAEVEKDEEGLQIMRTLGRNMAFMLKMSQGRRRCRRCKTGERGKDQDQLYQISDSYLYR